MYITQTTYASLYVMVMKQFWLVSVALYTHRNRHFVAFNFILGFGGQLVWEAIVLMLC